MTHLNERRALAHSPRLRQGCARTALAASLALIGAQALAAEATEQAPATAEAAAPEAPESEGGIKFDLLLKADAISNVRGGIKRGTAGFTNLDAKLGGDLGAIGLENTSFLLHGLANHGGKSNRDHVGSIMGVDNIEVDTNTGKLFQAWVDQKLPGDTSVLFGLYDFNSEFYATSTSGLFLNPQGGIGTEMAETGKNGPSIFPTSSLTLRLKWGAHRGLVCAGCAARRRAGRPEQSAPHPCAP